MSCVAWQSQGKKYIGTQVKRDTRRKRREKWNEDSPLVDDDSNSIKSYSPTRRAGMYVVGWPQILNGRAAIYTKGKFWEQQQLLLQCTDILLSLRGRKGKPLRDDVSRTLAGCTAAINETERRNKLSSNKNNHKVVEGLRRRQEIMKSFWQTP